MKYKHIAIGGTFDLLHEGHKQFIRHAFSLGERVTIGITSNELVEELKGRSYQGFSQRFKAVCDFVSVNQFLSRASVVRLNDFFGPTLNDKTIDCSLVTKDSLDGARMINEARVKSGLTSLPVKNFPLKVGLDRKVISSKRIRNGVINQHGLNYYDYLLKKGDLYLPQNLRTVLRKPFGKVYKNLRSIHADTEKKGLVATVGDFTTQSFLNSNVYFSLAIIDLKIQRVNSYQKVEDLGFSGIETIIKVLSPPGIISLALTRAVHKSLTNISNTKTIILVDGEEDLAVLPTVLMAPLGLTIYYGLRNEGLVMLKVTPEIKRVIFKLLQKF